MAPSTVGLTLHLIDLMLLLNVDALYMFLFSYIAFSTPKIDLGKG